jgi:HEPN domain-containing protein
MSNPDDPHAWIQKADADLLCIRNNLNAACIPWDTVCFHAQQAAEKLLKAFLVARGRRAARTHDLLLLLGECVAIESTLGMLYPACRLLNPYSVAFRYPGTGPEPSEPDGRAAVSAAESIRCAVLQALRPKPDQTSVETRPQNTEPPAGGQH